MKDNLMRNAFIRVSADNNTVDGVVNYNLEDIKSVVYDWSKSKSMSYYLIEHNEDGENKHYHIVLDFTNYATFKTIKNKFPHGDIEKCRNVKLAVRYLLHLDHCDKKQYDKAEIITNNSSKLEKYLKDSVNEKEMSINELLELIGHGAIREFEIVNYVSAVSYAKYKNKINGAVQYYYNLMKNSRRDIVVYVLQGETQTGKSTFAEEYCKKLNKSFCRSSSNNDPWQDYLGEDVMIFDDLRDSAFNYNDFLKMIDPNFRSSASSRYYNKTFIGDTIIITTNIDIRNWYKNVNESKNPLYRRIAKIYQFYRSDVELVSNYFLIHYDSNINDFVKESAIFSFDLRDYESEISCRSKKLLEASPEKVMI